MKRPEHEAADAATALVLEIFRSSGALLAAGDRLVGDLGLTSARWQVLGAVALAAQPLPVARIARDMGMTRQGVQRTVNELAKAGLVSLADNPHHLRARLVLLTPAGRDAYAAAAVRQAPWAAALARGLDPAALEAARTLVRTIGERAGERRSGEQPGDHDADR
ncbi:transcriptional regulator, MarR family [Methylorubrum extorquens]|uniref:Transcriptional regulator, MarR family n=1 Tax=Methylorubrum extorquens TaxID=408 RepID=A0A2N9AV02_METEX|nr:helix-turn-helix domain-containing protein [Methylorubrum zatmanii]ARO55260.1 MarR family transcriptional regulator [Methylorubrum zatmanii]KQP97342.1 MarR family transcriptional regulator [Methylobacterium sp. Leaf121]SOR31169.1 transcriptional regulator, MarR family [Methylorubrum extorquens]